MTIDPNNPIVQLCAEGMNLEGEGKRAEAAETFVRATLFGICNSEAL
ncbi:MAG: hypothetical protein RIF36_17600 [Imperialibacter sp.]